MCLWAMKCNVSVQQDFPEHGAKSILMNVHLSLVTMAEHAKTFLKVTNVLALKAILELTVKKRRVIVAMIHVLQEQCAKTNQDTIISPAYVAVDILERNVT